MSDKEMYCDDSNQIQMFYKMDLTLGYDPENPNADCDELFDIERQKRYLPDLLNAFQSTFMGKTFPLNDDQVPDGVKPAGHFLSFDNEFGVVLCVNFFIDSNILHNTESTKKILHELYDELDGQFGDGWGENAFGFKSNHQEIYMEVGELAKIVAPVMGHCSHFNVKWNSIDEIEHINWMLYLDNGAYDMMYRPKQFEENRKKSTEVYAKYGVPDPNTERDEFIKKNLDRFFRS